MRALASVLGPGLRFIRSQQSISGEIYCYAAVAGALCQCARPFWSALVYDSLEFADPASGRFQKRLLDLLSVEERHAIPAMVSAIRWRIRAYLAWEEEADATWREHGRHSASPPDAATSACAAAALLTPPHPGHPPQTSRHVASLGRWTHGSADLAGLCYLACYLSKAGEGIEDLEYRGAPPQPGWPLYFAAARAWDRAGFTWPGAIVEPPPAPRHHAYQAMALSASLDMNHDGPETRERFASVLDSAADFTQWTWDALAIDGVASGGAAMALSLSAIFRGASCL